MASKQDKIRNPKRAKGNAEPKIMGNLKGGVPLFSGPQHKPQRRKKEEIVPGKTPKQIAKNLELQPQENPPAVVEPGTNKNGDKRGMHLTPERAKEIRARRSFYPKTAPVIGCNTCAYASSCPKFKRNYECAYRPYLRQHGISSLADIVDAARAAVEATGQRLQLALLFERLSGTVSSDVTQLASTYLRDLVTVKDLMAPPDKREETNRITVEGKGLIAQLFAAPTREPEKKEARVIDVKAKPVIHEDHEEHEPTLAPAEAEVLDVLADPLAEDEGEEIEDEESGEEESVEG